jgi:hypothetical protein
MAYIATTRFNDATFEENTKYKEAKGVSGSLYCQRLRIKEKVPLNAPMFVIEMNNQHNRIEGIGLIRNLIVTDKYYKVYENSDFNRYIYKGEHRMTRDELCELNQTVVECIEQICFKGKTHQKRLPGITVVSDKLLASPAMMGLNLKKEVKTMFAFKYRADDVDC